MGALIGFEGRVVFHAFSQYIRLPPPWDWVAVTFALFGCAAVGLAQISGALGSSVDVTAAGGAPQRGVPGVGGVCLGIRACPG